MGQLDSEVCSNEICTWPDLGDHLHVPEGVAGCKSCQFAQREGGISRDEGQTFITLCSVS